ncbi:MAG: YggT family protein [Dehalococcoidia bacterium]|nr:YggT family protein [Dehalococcoidia bacterium]
MSNYTLIQIVNYIAYAVWILILMRSLFSFMPSGGNNPVANIVFRLTEPILAPIRRLMPRTGMFDFSPIIAILLIMLIQALLTAVLRG